MNPSSPEPSKNKAEATFRSHLPPYLPNREIDVYVVADGAEFPDLVKGGLNRAWMAIQSKSRSFAGFFIRSDTGLG